jgi:transcriptional regulator GlxA family with amidase domain
MTALGPQPHVVVVLLYPGVRLLDVTAPIEVYTVANEHGANYQVLTASNGGGSIRATGGLELGADVAWSEVAEPIDTLVVPGSPDWKSTTTDARLLHQVRRLTRISQRTAGICAGAFPLAAAGLLDGRKVATHWTLADLLATLYPSVDVDSDAIFVHDGAVVTSAGISAGLDLTLALVEADHGPDLARQVAKHLVMFMMRPGGQSQFSVRGQIPRPRHRRLEGLLDTIVEAPDRDHSVNALADRAGLSARHLTRLFRAELGQSVAAVVEQVRLEAATAMLEMTDDHLNVVARLAGFGGTETMRRAFNRRYGISPGAYRSRLRTTGVNTETKFRGWRA